MPARENPFPGLRAFERVDADFYFGRELQREQLLARMRLHRFLAVVGTSGSGKSSLVRAGLIPDLLNGYLDRGGPAWRIATIKPGNAPFVELSKALVGEFPGTSSASIEKILRFSSSGLNRFVKENLAITKENLLVVVDQFEELIRFTGEDAPAFVRLLLASTGQEHFFNPASEEGKEVALLPIYIVITMRSDFLGKCSRFHGLPEALNENQYLVPRLTREQQELAIEGPIEMAGAQIATRLVQRLLNDVNDSPDQLPVLQHAMMRTWAESAAVRAAGDEIDLDQYTSIGGMQEALNRDAENAFKALKGDPKLEWIARKVFQRLVEPGPIDEETRRPTLLSELSAVIGASKKEVLSVANVFCERGFLTISDADDPVVDVPHESLIRLWAKLRAWVQDETRFANIYLGLVRAPIEGRGPHRGEALRIAQKWFKDEQPNEAWAKRYTPEDPNAFNDAVKFLQDSGRSAQKRKMFTILTAGTIASLLIAVALVSSLFWFNQKKQTKTIQGLLEDSRNNAEKYYQTVAKEQSYEAQTIEALKESNDAVKLEEETVRANSLAWQGTSLLVRSRVKDAISKYEEVLNLNKKGNDKKSAVVTDLVIGTEFERASNYYDAVSYLKDAVNQSDSKIDPQVRASAFVELGNAYLMAIRRRAQPTNFLVTPSSNQLDSNEIENLPEFAFALQAYKEALKIYHGLGDHWQEASVAGLEAAEFGLVANDRADIAQPRVLEATNRKLATQQVELSAYQEVVKPDKSINVYLLTQEANLYTSIGNTLKALGKNSEARDAFRHAISIDRDLSLSYAVDSTYVQIGKLFTPGSKEYAQEAGQAEAFYESPASNLGHDPLYNGLSHIASFYSAVGDNVKARQYASQAVELDIQSLDLDGAVADQTQLVNALSQKKDDPAYGDAFAVLNLLIKPYSVFPTFSIFRASQTINTLRSSDSGYFDRLSTQYDRRIEEARAKSDKKSVIFYTLLRCTLKQQNPKDPACLNQSLADYLSIGDASKVPFLLVLLVTTEMNAEQWPSAKNYLVELDNAVIGDASVQHVPQSIRVGELRARIDQGQNLPQQDLVDDRLNLASLYASYGDKRDEGSEYLQAARLLDSTKPRDPKKAIDYYVKANNAYKDSSASPQSIVSILSALAADYESIHDSVDAKQARSEILAIQAFISED